MTLTILFDLDDTLLRNPIQTFLPAYLNALSASLDEFPADFVIQCLLNATRQMIASPSPTMTLEENFDRHFYSALGVSRQSLQAKIDRFYAETYPSLSKLTEPQPLAAEIVRAASLQGHLLVIATNPVFPATAIHQRIEWAGFKDISPFALVTDYAHFHFAKPDPAFLAEVLAQLGWPDQPSVMVGNDLKEDLTPASALGWPVFWVNQGEANLPAGFHSLSRSGELAEVTGWLKEIGQSRPEIEISSSTGILAVLKSTPAAIDTFLRKTIPTERWQHQPAEDEWNSAQVICHLRDVEVEVNLPRLRKIISDENPFIPGVSTDEWASQRDYLHQDLFDAFDGFLRARLETIQLLEGLDPAGWLKPARHAIFGPTTLQELVGFIALHDQDHLRQMYPLLFGR